MVGKHFIIEVKKVSI